MKIHIHLLPGCLALAILPLLFCSCVEKSKKSEPPKTEAASETQQAHQTIIEPSLLPDRFRQTGYMVVGEEKNADSQKDSTAGLEALQLKVGSSIATTQPIPLREAMKAIVRTKNMSLSWAPDVDQELLVDIDVRANDNFYEAIDNILRQLDYFQEVEGSTLVIKYRETKKYHIAMPFLRQYYDSDTGSTAGKLYTKLNENKYDQWEVIQQNLDSLIKTWVASVSNVEVKKADAEAKTEESKKVDAGEKKGGKEEEVASVQQISRRASSSDSTYTIDKPVGLITVHAPKSLQKKIADYLSSLEKELFKQIIIEAKIIEVALDESSSLGINWNMLMRNLSLDGVHYGKSKTYDRKDTNENRTDSQSDFSDSTTDASNKTTSNSRSTKREEGSSGGSGVETTWGWSEGNSTGSEDSSGRSVDRTINNALSMGTTAATFISSGGSMAEAIATGVTLTGFNFTSFIKALQDQGQTSILSNPKISVMNGQPALISVGKHVTYIKEVSTTQTEGGGLSSSVQTAQILSGIGLALSAVVKDDKEIVMNLVPITSELSEPVEYKDFGSLTVGLPVVNKREMNTTVKIKDGSMLVVGGLISEIDSKSGESLPGAGNIPYLKHLFGYETKQKKKRELIILLRPRIIN